MSAKDDVSGEHVRYEILDCLTDGLLLRTNHCYKVFDHYKKIVARHATKKDYIHIRVVLKNRNIVWVTNDFENFKVFEENFVQAYNATEGIYDE